MKYEVTVLPLSKRDGGGFAAFAPDLPGCMSDGETPEEALKNAQQAIWEWLETARTAKMRIPPPGNARQLTQQLNTKLVEVLQHLEQVDDRLDQFASEIEELREAIEHNEAWSRFGELVQDQPTATLISRSRDLPRA